MNDTTFPAPSGARSRRLPAAVVLAAVILWWLVTSENGAVLAVAGDGAQSAGAFLHELMHDGRHVLGAPCH